MYCDRLVLHHLALLCGTKAANESAVQENRYAHPRTGCSRKYGYDRQGALTSVLPGYKGQAM